jgi:hypothetical protein
VGAAALLRWLSQWLAMRSTLASAAYSPMDLPIPVRVTSAGLTPGVFGVFRPELILPRAVMRELTASQIQTVVAHEMCHVRRRDNPTAAIHKMMAMAIFYGPVLAGVVTAAARETSDGGRILFETITLTPVQRSWWDGDAKFDPAGRLSLDNVSLRDLIALAYPASRVNGDPELIDRTYYNIHARWRSDSVASARSVYRELLKHILRTNSNLQLYVKEGCDIDCAWLPGELAAGRSYL